MDNTHIIICGLGGQGIIFTEKIFSFCLSNAGYDVKVSEIHGLAQRGGSVCAEISYGNKVFSPVISAISVGHGVNRDVSGMFPIFFWILVTHIFLILLKGCFVFMALIYIAVFIIHYFITENLLSVI